MCAAVNQVPNRLDLIRKQATIKCGMQQQQQQLLLLQQMLVLLLLQLPVLLSNLVDRVHSVRHRMMRSRISRRSQCMRFAGGQCNVVAACAVCATAGAQLAGYLLAWVLALGTRTRTRVSHRCDRKWICINIDSLT